MICNKWKSIWPLFHSLYPNINISGKSFHLYCLIWRNIFRLLTLIALTSSPMSKYSIKQELQRLSEQGNEISALTRFFILEGYSYDQAKESLEAYVSWWEESVAYIEQSSVNDIGSSEEYDHDLWARSELFKALQYASEDDLSKVKKRISLADQRFINATEQTHIADDHIDNPDMELHWWLFRKLKK